MNDLISRSALLKKQTYMFDEALGTSPCVLTEDIKAAPTVDAVPVKHGRWRLNRDGSGTCSNCRRTQLNVWDFDNYDNYCAHCGADMRGPEADEQPDPDDYCSAGERKTE